VRRYTSVDAYQAFMICLLATTSSSKFHNTEKTRSLTALTPQMLERYFYHSEQWSFLRPSLRLSISKSH